MNAITKTDRAPALPVLSPTNFGELERFATIAAKSEFVPKEFRGRPADVMLAVQMGSELGLAPLQALQNIACINGRPSLWGDAMLALCTASPLCDDVQETMEGSGDELTAVCVAKRKGRAPVTGRFSVTDAKRAGLWQTEARVTRRRRDGNGTYEAENDSPWFRYPDRMLKMRARGFALRDAFPDLLRGMIAREEAEDYPGKTIEAVAEPVVAAPSPVDKSPQPVDNSGNGDAVTQPNPEAEALENARRFTSQAAEQFRRAATRAAIDAVERNYARHVARLRIAYPDLASQFDEAKLQAEERVAMQGDPVEAAAERGADLLSGG